ncbi:hypothetical protein N7481_001738 [Penicillium waksmanii]|uniref:uncharacterized protein n=1 Tax=Penicillium waksmanii TaxID=69791 RepID=UPI002549BF3B|nr:uncharacterized protein N7481_001738 [Penicillium waksmanii]KAJ5994761.1 hypothetical protein N7481_001738 [Penicillium waksmanii]
MATFEGKVFSVTGAGSGIGAATAKVLYSRGASLALCDLQFEALEKIARELKPVSAGQHLSYNAVDVRKTEDVNQWTDGIIKEFDRLDGAANIAGAVRILPLGTLLEDTTDEDWDFTIQTNAAGLQMSSFPAESHEKWGAIVNMTSVAGLDGAAGCGAYSPSKHAVIGITRTAALEAAPKGIRVNGIAPGLIDTPMAATDNFPVETFLRQVPMKRIAQPEEIGRMVAVLLSDDASYMTGEIVRIDGGLRA